MNWVTIKRVIKYGYLNFRRNGWLSTATVLVMTMALFVLGWLMMLSVVANTALSSLENKIDISVYFKNNSNESDITAVKEDLTVLPEVAKVDYVSSEEALNDFRKRHKDNKLISDSLEELGGNPLSASLNIKAKDARNYAAISEFLSAKNYPAIDKINYFENQKVIERLSSVVNASRLFGSALVLFLGFIAVLVAFNTVRLAIYTMREEINIMRLVGATAWFIRGPFLFEGMIYGAIASLVATFSFFPILWVISSPLSAALSGVNISSYFKSNFFEFFGIMVFAGISLGVISSFIAIRRYLKV